MYKYVYAVFTSFLVLYLCHNKTCDSLELCATLTCTSLKWLLTLFRFRFFVAATAMRSWWSLLQQLPLRKSALKLHSSLEEFEIRSINRTYDSIDV